MSTTDTDDPLGGETPLAVIMSLLAARAEGNDVDEEKLEYAVCLTACATLVNKGLDVETAMAAVESALSHGDIHVSYSEAEGLEVTIGEGVDADEMTVVFDCDEECDGPDDCDGSCEGGGIGTPPNEPLDTCDTLDTWHIG